MATKFKASLISFIFLGACLAQSAFPQNKAKLDYQLKPRGLAPNVYVIEGQNADFSLDNGCNIINTGFIVTNDGILVINTGPSRKYGEQQRAAIAKVSTKPIAKVLHLNLHPDYFLGNQGFSGAPLAATPLTLAGMRAEKAAYEDNMYRLCGDWMKATESVIPTDKDASQLAAMVASGGFKLGERDFQLVELKGHTDSDLVLLDKQSGVLFAGGLVFHERIPTTPHAKIGPWLSALDALAKINFKTIVPSHGPIAQNQAPITQTRSFLRWVDQAFSDGVAKGWEISDMRTQGLPPQFRRWAAADTEFIRNLTHLYPVYEERFLSGTSSAPK